MNVVFNRFSSLSLILFFYLSFSVNLVADDPDTDDPKLERQIKATLAKQQKALEMEFKNLATFYRKNRYPEEVQESFREIADVYKRLKKPVFIGLGALQKEGQVTHVFGLRFETAELIEKKIYHIEIEGTPRKKQHFLLDLGEFDTILPIKHHIYCPALLLQLDELESSRTVGGESIHTLRVLSFKAVPGDLVDAAKMPQKTFVHFVDEGKVFGK